MSRARHAQEMRNGVGVMRRIEHLAVHADVGIDLKLICHFNQLILRDTPRAGVGPCFTKWTIPSARRGGRDAP